jgi:hypothetical protein
MDGHPFLPLLLLFTPYGFLSSEKCPYSFDREVFTKDIKVECHGDNRHDVEDIGCLNAIGIRG